MKKIIDTHVHCEFTGKDIAGSGVRDDVASYQRDRDHMGIVAAVSDSAQPNPNVDLSALGVRLCAVIDRIDFDLEAIAHGLRQGRYAAVKINLGFVHMYAGDQRLRAVYEQCQAAAVPVLFHTGDPGWGYAKIKFADPMTIDEVAVDHPKTTFVLMHAGNPWFQTAAVVADKNRNVYLDGSTLLEGNMRNIAPHRLQRLMIEPIAWLTTYLSNPRKLMFGSGWPMVDLPSYLEAFQSAVPVSLRDAIFFETAAEIFRVST
jgi:uncharacterized protein